MTLFMARSKAPNVYSTSKYPQIVYGYNRQYSNLQVRHCYLAIAFSHRIFLRATVLMKGAKITLIIVHAAQAVPITLAPCSPAERKVLDVKLITIVSPLVTLLTITMQDMLWHDLWSCSQEYDCRKGTDG